VAFRGGNVEDIMRFKVEGADRATGDERAIVVEAQSANDAINWANKVGLLVSACHPIGGTAAPLATAARSTKKQRVQWNLTRLVPGLLAAALWAGYYFYSAVDAPNPAVPPAGLPDQDSPPTAINSPAGSGDTIDADALYQAYSSNEFSADEKFKGKTVLVRGIIGKVGRELRFSIEGGPKEVPCVALQAKYHSEIQVPLSIISPSVRGPLVNCFFDPGEQEKLSGLTLGNAVTMTGTCQGLQGYCVEISGCTLVGQ
jgi:hypothetical protein